ncbi:MAG TPA: zinc ribbon domain-containing protein, partial [Pirellulales bacterium]
RQYGATERSAGQRFRCRCGTIVMIAEPKGHDAKVVRCSSCGAPRRDGATCCEFCGADFTLHEKDLGTVCPHCFARISDAAKYCDHCGYPLAAEPLEIEESPLPCPNCGPARKLSSRTIEGDELHECQACAGIWIGIETFRHLVRRAGDDGQHAAVRISPPAAGSACLADSKARGHRHYVPCPVCQSLMARQSFGFGVIVDLCKHHGIWFDADKLTFILDSVRTGGQEAANAELQTISTRKALAEESQPVEQIVGCPSLGDELERDSGLALGVSKTIGFLANMFMR